MTTREKLEKVLEFIINEENEKEDLEDATEEEVEEA